MPSTKICKSVKFHHFFMETCARLVTSVFYVQMWLSWYMLWWSLGDVWAQVGVCFGVVPLPLEWVLGRAGIIAGCLRVFMEWGRSAPQSPTALASQIINAKKELRVPVFSLKNPKWSMVQNFTHPPMTHLDFFFHLPLLKIHTKMRNYVLWRGRENKKLTQCRKFFCPTSQRVRKFSPPFAISPRFIAAPPPELTDE